jgi:hypothetical protein
VKFNHPELANLIQTAYSAERAASLAYIGHAGSLRSRPVERARVKEIEQDEWNHRSEMKSLLEKYEIPVSKWYELKFYIIGQVIGFSCYFIGRFMPYFFAGKLESGNVCEYFVMMHYFHELGITEHDEILYTMGVKEKEHEVFFLEMIKSEPWLPLFEKIFNWGTRASANDVDLDDLKSVAESKIYCQSHHNLNPDA